MSNRSSCRRLDWCKWGLAPLAVMVATPASAQGALPVDAGSLLRQEERNRQELPQALPKPEIAPPPPVAQPVEADALLIEAVHFEGDGELLSEKERADLAARIVGQRLGFAGLTGFAQQVTAYLKARGWLLARAWLPPQDVTDGTVTIAILGGRLDGQGAPYRVMAEPPGSLRISRKRLEGMARAQVAPGAVLSEQDLTRALLLMNDLPGVSARASLEAGEEPGSTRVVIAAQQRPLLRPSFVINNFGSESTGVRQATASLGIDDPVGWGDRWSAALVKARGLTLKSFSYALPVGYSGVTLQASHSRLVYRAGAGTALKAGLAGRGRTTRAGLSAPLIRSSAANLTVSFDWLGEDVRDDTRFATFNTKRTRAMNLAVSGDLADGLGGGGRTMWALRPMWGRFSAGVLAARERGEKGFDSYGTTGGFAKIAFQLSRIQSLVPRASFYLNVQGQVASRNLDSSHKFYPAGPSAVRAYASGEASADGGVLAQAELRYAFALPGQRASVQLAAFYDGARVWLHHDPRGLPIDTVSRRNAYGLHGAGLGATLAMPGGSYLRASWATPIGSNPGRAAPIPGQPARRDGSRAWVQAGIQF